MLFRSGRPGPRRRWPSSGPRPGCGASCADSCGHWPRGRNAAPWPAAHSRRCRSPISPPATIASLPARPIVKSPASPVAPILDDAVMPVSPPRPSTTREPASIVMPPPLPGENVSELILPVARIDNSPKTLTARFPPSPVAPGFDWANSPVGKFRRRSHRWLTSPRR